MWRHRAKEPFVALRLPRLFNIRSDPFENQAGIFIRAPAPGFPSS